MQANFGQAVRELREEAGISQEALALKADLSRSYFSAVERGLRNVGIVNVAKMADALGTTSSAILVRAEKIGAL